MEGRKISTDSEKWFQTPKPRQRPRLRIFCLPYAGGSATIYHRWSQRLPDDVEVLGVQLPGRLSRYSEPPLRSMGAILRALTPRIAQKNDAPFIFFGHSFGALLAFELTRALRAGGFALPLCLMVSARRAPHALRERPPMHGLPRAEFIAELYRRYGGQEEVLSKKPALADLVMPSLRADFEVFERYQYREEPALAVPIVAFAGAQDEGASAEALMEWRRHTLGLFTLRELNGGHFFIDEDPLPLLAEIRAVVDAF